MVYKCRVCSSYFEKKKTSNRSVGRPRIVPTCSVVCRKKYLTEQKRGYSKVFQERRQCTVGNASNIF